MMKVALVCCGRLENRYAVEFIEYYKRLGFDHIYIADNNHEGEEHFEDVLQSYMDDKFVSILDYRNKEAIQMTAYKEIYESIKNLYDWIAFYDFDEYLTLVEDINIKDYLSRDCFKDYRQILINYKVYTDNDLIYDDGRPLLERFTTSREYDNVFPYLQNQFKSILKGNLENVSFYVAHCFDEIYDDYMTLTEKYSCNSVGKTIFNEQQFNVEKNYDLAYIKHFTTKTIDEYINNKLIRGVGDRTYKNFKGTYSLDKFFKINSFTDKKIEYLKTKLNYSDKKINKLKEIITIFNS